MAKILRRGVYVFLTLALMWVIFWWQAHPLVAVAGGFCLLVGFAPVLGIQFLTIWKVNRRYSSPQATLWQHISAWWAEVVLTVKVFVGQQAYREHRFGDTIAPIQARPVLIGAVQTGARLSPSGVENEGFPKKQRGIVFIHGFLCNRGFWNPWLQRLQRANTPYLAISLEPVFTSIDEYAPQIEKAVMQLTAHTGMPPLLVCHSMGGLSARAWLRTDSAHALRVSHIVTIGTPHHGTGIVRGPSFAANATQMQKNSAWITALAADESAGQPGTASLETQDSATPTGRVNPYAHFTCFYSNCDNIVFPTQTATLDGADNRFAPGLAHVQMAFDETVMRESLAKL